MTSSTVLLASATVAAMFFGGAPAMAQPGLEGSRWSILEVYGEPLPQDEAPFIAFDGEGQFTGRTACNWFHGTYSSGDDSIVLLTRLTTLRGCVIGNKRRSDATLEALDSAASFSLTGALLTFSDETGEPVARLERQAGDSAAAP